MPVFDNGDNRITDLAKDRGRLAMIRMAFEEARAGNPDVRLLINDFDLSPAYEAVIEEVLAAGIRIDAIGLQTHMHQGYRGEAPPRRSTGSRGSVCRCTSPRRRWCPAISCRRRSRT